MRLEDLSTRDLKRELEKRNKLKKTGRPEKKDNIDFTDLINYCEEHIDNILDADERDDEHWVYEAAIECIYGKKFWDWYNNLDCGR